MIIFILDVRQAQEIFFPVSGFIVTAFIGIVYNSNPEPIDGFGIKDNTAFI
ncbi:hypothetical protein SDC9_142994 [bioreactor metagenome]|uniref:Uncharacterized protein n=1 Tax=bioreactor metagenome TaxID=1076179 RepID=A0A645E2S9_9ZZZZ